MQFAILFLTLFTTLSIAAPSPLENALASAYSKMSAQQKLVAMTILELTRRKNGGEATDSILQPVASEKQVPGFVNSLARFLPFDAGNLIAGISAMGQPSSVSRTVDAEVDGEINTSLTDTLRSLGISV
jgi:hypothetical protein